MNFPSSVENALDLFTSRIMSVDCNNGSRLRRGAQGAHLDATREKTTIANLSIDDRAADLGINLPSWALYAFVASSAAAVLAGCGAAGAPSQSIANVPTHSLATYMLARTDRTGIVPEQRLARGQSWMDSNASKRHLIYASDMKYGTVDVYDYRVKDGKLEGQLTGFTYPYGECLDRLNNVYIVDFDASTITEFAHAGTSPIAVADDSYGNPIGCSVDPTTGDVAVSNYYGNSGSGSGGIVIYAGGLTGTATNYRDPNLHYLYPPGYDNKGNVYVEGMSSADINGIAELPKGGGNLIDLTLSGASIGSPAGVQWVNPYVVFADTGYEGSYTEGLYSTTISGTTATVVSTSQLIDTCFMSGNPENTDVVQPFIYGSKKNRKVLGGNLWCASRIDIWALAQGGDPNRVLSSNVVPATPYGQVISPQIAK